MRFTITAGDSRCVMFVVGLHSYGPGTTKHSHLQNVLESQPTLLLGGSSCEPESKHIAFRSTIDATAITNPTATQGHVVSA